MQLLNLSRILISTVSVAYSAKLCLIWNSVEFSWFRRRIWKQLPLELD